MRYTTYYEENRKVNMDRYEQIKQAALQEQPKTIIEWYTLRKLRFVQTAVPEEKWDDSIPKYYICMKDEDSTQLYLEKKYIQNGVVYKRCEKLDEEEAKKILAGEVEWMKNNKKELMEDFYLQYTLNKLRPSHITEYVRETLKYKKGYVTFVHRVSRIAGGEVDIFGRNGIPIQCLSEDHVNVIYKKEVTLPQMILNMIQVMEEPVDEFAFAF